MPKAAAEAEELIRAFAGRGVGVLLVEQNVRIALDICERLYIMECGNVKRESMVTKIDGTTLFHHLEG